jgi:hypothetical protein
MSQSPAQLQVAAAAAAHRKPLVDAKDVVWLKRYAKLVESGKIMRVRLERREGVYYVYEIDKDGKPMGSGIPASPFMIALWLECKPLLEAR